jgi:hypothetical protein
MCACAYIFRQFIDSDECYVDMVAKVNGYLTHDIDLALQPTDQSLNMPTYYMGTVYLCTYVCTYMYCEIASTCQVVFNCLSIN